MKNCQNTQQEFGEDNSVADTRNYMPSSEQIQPAARELEGSPAYLQAHLRQGPAEAAGNPRQLAYSSFGMHAATTFHEGQGQHIDANDDIAIELTLPELGEIQDEPITNYQIPNPILAQQYANPQMYPPVQSVLSADDASGRAEDVHNGLPYTYTDGQGSVLASNSDASWVYVTPEPPAIGQEPQTVNLSPDTTYRNECWSAPIEFNNVCTLTERPRRGPKIKPKKRVNPYARCDPRTAFPCFGCRRDKKRCDDGIPCFPCESIKPDNTLYAIQLCLRYTVSDAALYRVQKEPMQRYSQRWPTMDIVDIDARDWVSNDILNVQISPTFFHFPIDLKFRRFKPNEQDVTFTSWWNGSRMQRYDMPPYAIANLSEAAEAYGKAIDQHVVSIVNGTIGGHEELIRGTYFTALRHALRTQVRQSKKEKQFLIDIFRFWVACRITSNPAHMTGSEKLGLAPINDKSSRMHGMVPLPPIITPQEQIIIYSKFLIPLGQKIVHQLEIFLKDANPRIFYTAYLGLFMILHSCSMLTRRNEEYAREIAHREQYANPESIFALQSGAITMLAHFHANKGTRLFHLDKASTDLYQGQIDVLNKTTALVEEKRANGIFVRLRAEQKFSDDLYWVSQLYDKDWVPDLQP